MQIMPNYLKTQYLFAKKSQRWLPYYRTEIRQLNSDYNFNENNNMTECVFSGGVMAASLAQDGSNTFYVNMSNRPCKNYHIFCMSLFEKLGIKN